MKKCVNKVPSRFYEITHQALRTDIGKSRLFNSILTSEGEVVKGTWSIMCESQDGDVLESYLYESKDEYDHDIKLIEEVFKERIPVNEMIIVILLPIDKYSRKDAELVENMGIESIAGMEGIFKYPMTDFMDDCNNQAIELENYWLTYIKTK